MVWIVLTLIIGVTVVAMALRDAARERQHEIRRAVWPWAQAYYALRDGLDDQGPPDDLPGRKP